MTRESDGVDRRQRGGLLGDRRRGGGDRRRRTRSQSDGHSAVTRVGIADQRALICETLAESLAGNDGVNFVGACSNQSAVVGFVNSLRPDILVLEAELDGARGLNVLGELASCVSRPAIILLAGEPDRISTAQAIRMGASAVISTTAPFQELLEAIHWTARGKVWLSREQLSDFLDVQGRNTNDGLNALDALTRRERDILALLVDGLGHAAIAERLYLSANTVRTHSQNLQKKLGVQSAIAAVAVAIASGAHPS